MQSGRSTTLSEVARRAGVSLTTASKAINGQPRVSSEARDRVLKAARELAYTPNRIARSLMSGRTGTVGLVVVDSNAQRFALPILLGAEEALSKIDLSMTVSDARGDRARLRRIVERFAERQVDGVLVVGDNNTRTPRVGRRLDQPVVYVYGETGSGDVVHLPDDRAGAREITEHVLRSGRTRIAVVTGPREARAVVERGRGIADALEAAGLGLVHDVLHGEWSQRSGRVLAERLLRAEPDVDAIVTGSDQIAAGVAEALRGAGLRVPEDVALTGFDNWPIFALETEPPLTTVDMNLHTLGAAAVRDLFDLIDGKPVGGGVRLHPCSVVVRESVARH
ncbi:LacI family transcriptional regulator [Streptomyces sp. OfavH-34-F]|uniref:LacI family DNA-binding transcriptional regulator n=1 Tax=Streptomyces sp. OfavH-34-F TaxID=2917760 RepID=UPI001EF3D055|nr:LacI family DNA-binding transcriptional regulator [Streptomyces sp. OfavH-34-F]MCG7523634.1 LacI family transcriptional regulator [Streptomyces sp. OfavH-34-F]